MNSDDSNGLWLDPNLGKYEIRSIVRARCKEFTDDELVKATNYYLKWKISGNFELDLSCANQIYYEYLVDEFPNRIDGLLAAYDILCREMAERFGTSIHGKRLPE
jgi:hypothetical protein